MSKEKKPLIYVAKAKRMTITVPEIDENGDAVALRDPVTGHHIRYNGRPAYIDTTITFVNVINSVSKGLLSRYEVTEDTPKPIADKLKALAEDRKSGVMTQDHWVKTHNPDAYKEIEARRAMEKRLKAEYEAKIEAAKAEGAKEAAQSIATSKQELSNLKGANTKKDNAIDDLKKQVAALKKGA